MQLAESEHLRVIFNNSLEVAFPDSKLPGMEPVVALNFNPEGVALIKLRTPEMARLALLALNGVTLGGYAMNVQRLLPGGCPFPCS